MYTCFKESSFYIYFFASVFSHQLRRELVLHHVSLTPLFLASPSATVVPLDTVPLDRQFPSDKPFLPPIQTGQIKLVMVEFSCIVFN